ncbi:MAG: hypothetical protein J1E40_12440 [Oscillospiraceae bacterium]|nr:hypothetical protein [Oscillospiraceae bacterium]
MKDGIHYSDLNASFLCEAFPELENEICKIDFELGEQLPHCLLGDLFNPLMVRLLKSPEQEDILLARRIFDFYERLAEYGDEETRNLLQVTLLEYLWDDYEVYSRAVEMMGEQTRLINQGIGSYLRKPIK